MPAPDAMPEYVIHARANGKDIQFRVRAPNILDARRLGHQYTADAGLHRTEIVTVTPAIKGYPL
jgi:hypothetical protein